MQSELRVWKPVFQPSCTKWHPTTITSLQDRKQVCKVAMLLKKNGFVWNNSIDHSCVYGCHQKRFSLAAFFFSFRCLLSVVVLFTVLCLFFRGWGLRSLDDIPMGTFVCTYAGQILNEDMANKVRMRDFISLSHRNDKNCPETELSKRKKQKLHIRCIRGEGRF